MNLKKLLTFNILIIFCLTFVSHFVYDFLPTSLNAIFFPVNESIFEHMKMIYTTFLIDGLILYIFLKVNNINFNNFFISLLLSSIISITSFLIIWLPIYYRIGENLPITLIVLFISICLSQIVNFYILSSFKNKTLNFISLGFIILFIILLAYFTYHPLYNDFFFDPIEEKYGINNYLIK